MKNEVRVGLKVGITVAVIEAILGLTTGMILFRMQEESIEKKTVETIAGYFDGVDERMSYGQALEFLYQSSKEKDQVIESLTQENEELSKFKAQELSDAANVDIIESAQTAAASEDYKMALAILKSVSNKTSQMEVLISDYESKFESAIISQVTALIYDEQYDAAVDLLDDALKTLPNSSILKQSKTDVQQSKPQALMGILPPYETKGYREKLPSDFMEMGGERYSNGFELGTSFETSYAIFNLNGRYKKLSGTIGHIDGSGERDKVVTIFADGVLVQTIDVFYQDLPQEFSIDLDGVKQLKIERTDGDTRTGFADLYIR